MLGTDRKRLKVVDVSWLAVIEDDQAKISSGMSLSHQASLASNGKHPRLHREPCFTRFLGREAGNTGSG